MKIVTTEDVHDVGRLPRSTLQAWVDKGVVVPADPGGRGRGNSRTFPLMTAVGLAVASRVLHSERGCVLSYVRRVVEAFAAVNPEWLEERLREGGTRFAGPHHGRPLLAGETRYGWVDIAEVYEELKARATERTAALAADANG